MARKNTNRKAVAEEVINDEMQEPKVDEISETIVEDKVVDEEPIGEVTHESTSVGTASVNHENNQDEGKDFDSDGVGDSPRQSFNSNMFGYSWNGMEMDW